MSRGPFVRQMLARYGQAVEVWKSEKEAVAVRALIQALGRRSQGDPEVWTPIGSYDPSYSYYIGPAGCRVDKMNRPLVTVGGKRYRAVRAEAVIEGNRVLYVWAVLKKLPGEEEDDRDADIGTSADRTVAGRSDLTGYSI